MKKKIVLSAGDPSGDVLLSRVVQHIHKMAPGAYDFVGLCGPLTQVAGARSLVDPKDVAVVGAFEVFRNISKIFEALKILKSELKGAQSLLCVDFPDFNFRLAEMAYKKNIPVDYMVAPQVWAWRSGRMVDMKRWLRRLYPALSFEQEIFREAGIDARYLGHPLRDALPPKNRKDARSSLALKETDFAMGLFPGSRKAEIRRHLPLILEGWMELEKLSEWKALPYSFKALISKASSYSLSDFKSFLSPKKQKVFEGLLNSGSWILAEDSHKAMMASDFGWVASGTATLEAAYYQLPHLLIYKLNSFSVGILKSLSSYFSDPNAAAGLPNIMLGRKVIPELLQNDLSPKRLAAESVEYLMDAPWRDRLKKELRWIPKKMGDAGAGARIAEDLLKLWGP